MPPTLYILYNASSTLLGKLNYTYRKLTAPKCAPACAACDITHGGLHLDETAAWKEAKAEMGNGVEVKQLHRDEVGGEVCFCVLMLVKEMGVVWCGGMGCDGMIGGGFVCLFN